jgi:hypothetical protein
MHKCVCVCVYVWVWGMCIHVLFNNLTFSAPWYRLRWARMQAAAYVHSCVATLVKQQGRTFPPTKLRQVMKRVWSDCKFPEQKMDGGLEFNFSEIIGVEKGEVSLFRSENTESQIPASTSPTAERLSQLVEPDAFVQNAEANPPE